jgi:aldehyde dehydrogenase (NAD+)
MTYIESGKADGATVHAGGGRHGTEGYFIQPTVFTDVTPNMKIIQEEISGPVVAIAKFKDEAGTNHPRYMLVSPANVVPDIITQANNSIYGLAAAVFSKDISRALKVAHALEAGTVWVNCYNQLSAQVPFGGFKQCVCQIMECFPFVMPLLAMQIGYWSGIGRVRTLKVSPR